MVGIGAYEDDTQDATGAEIAVTWGEEAYSPVQYQSFRVGAFTLRGRVLPGETYEGAHARLLNAARACAAEQFRVQLADHLDRVRTASASAKGGR
jgi:hypothetical protein